MYRYDGIDILRGIASLAVLIGHYFNVLIAYNPSVQNTIFWYSPFHSLWGGREAVILFFIISGFVLMNIFTNNIYINYSKFIQKRLVRIYIPYISSIILSIIFFLLFCNYPLKEAGYWFNVLWAEPLTIVNVLNHILFIGYYDSNTINGSIWSLVHELRISIIFPILALILLRFKKRAVIYAFFAFVSILSYYIRDEYKPMFITDIMYTLYFISFFILGAIINIYRDNVIEYFNLIKPVYKVSIFILSIYLYSYKWSIFPHNEFIHNTLINDLVICIGGSGILIVFLSLQFNKLHKLIYKVLLTLANSHH